MSSSGTAQCTARHRSGRWVMRRAHEQPAVGAAADGQPVPRACAAVVTRWSAAAWKSSNTFCLCSPPPRLVPRLALLVAAAEAGDREQAAGFGPRRDRRRPGRRLGDGEPAVAGEDARRVDVGRLVGAVDQEQADLGAVGGRVALLRHGELRSRAPTRRRSRSPWASRAVAALPAEEAGRAGEALELQEGQRRSVPVPSRPTTEHSSGSATSPIPAPSGAWRVMRAGGASRCVTTSRPPATGSACWMTPSPSGTRVVHSSGRHDAASSGMATTRPRARVERGDGDAGAHRRTGPSVDRVDPAR